MVIQLKIASGRVAVGEDNESATESENPAVNMTAAASPMAFPTARSVAVAMPGSTCFSTTRRV